MSTAKKSAKKANKPVNNRNKAGQFKKGTSGNPKGRKPGTKNKYSQILMDLVFDIQKDLATKKKGLKDCAEQDPKWFYEKFLAKVLPKPVEISGEVEGEITLKWEK